MNEYLEMWKRYVDFSGRTSVRGFWMAFLFNTLAAIALTGVSMIIRTSILSSIYSLAGLIPGVALTIRRLRDAGKNPVWILISLVPCIGTIMLIVFLCKPSIDDAAQAAV